MVSVYIFCVSTQIVDADDIDCPSQIVLEMGTIRMDNPGKDGWFPSLKDILWTKWVFTTFLTHFLAADTEMKTFQRIYFGRIEESQSIINKLLHILYHGICSLPDLFKRPL